ncbi:DUF305 domain-containing protein [Nocardioides acrostichi]|uniref:DUF305 domain-containing protein n=1 Tax=Nocardioides acrostichi TaxID=2784339 RepID=A0A930UZC9_9ACTN|nr:DUF305 domain-containing protein [Nocardioides acrostichi]MBF4160830.1 DUF305 domain-containing protein [Nocardioides acrostichi]
MRRRRRGAVATALVVALGAGLVGCGNDASSDPAAVSTATDGSVYDQADVDFLTGMIPHHAQAVQMVTMAQGRQVSPKVRALMDSIRDAQVPEVEQMSDWLEGWGKAVPATSLDHAHGASGMDDMEGMEGMDGDQMAGMMSGDQMSELEQSSDADFERLWLQMMIEHHTGAVDSAETEIDDGKNPEVLELAQSIVTSQTAEIEQMKAMLGEQ